jgi:hypothetical protein
MKLPEAVGGIQFYKPDHFLCLAGNTVSMLHSDLVTAGTSFTREWKGARQHVVSSDCCRSCELPSLCFCMGPFGPSAWRSCIYMCVQSSSHSLHVRIG